ncbi:hypothetical protein Lesp02_70580 [Lentzea sp. NBRC 105346]|uniref:hypothetical protein n=1 Tax=Lentzea sp. NBRC 105346 TaxID=3032205 RepID=UPI0024A503FD|nr:hypothetical protein [Lentzea sp. NBRC 105346]GLZ34871.1 hypothetical protein Lesp02_70580 [Lentzea sp. NBRC 105346]
MTLAERLLCAARAAVDSPAPRLEGSVNGSQILRNAQHHRARAATIAVLRELAEQRLGPADPERMQQWLTALAAEVEQLDFEPNQWFTKPAEVTEHRADVVPIRPRNGLSLAGAYVDEIASFKWEGS